MDSGKVTSANEYNCGGSYTVNGERIKCWKSGGHGHETLKKAVQNSCNPAFMQMALSMGKSTFTITSTLSGSVLLPEAGSAARPRV